MPIGKDSITKRVAKVDVQPTENTAPELVATTAAAPAAKKAPTKKPAASKTETAAKKAPAKKPAATAKKAPSKKSPATEAEATPVATNVLSNAAPETVEAVIGHKEDAKYEKVSIGDDMPVFLM